MKQPWYRIAATGQLVHQLVDIQGREQRRAGWPQRRRDRFHRAKAEHLAAAGKIYTQALERLQQRPPQSLPLAVAADSARDRGNPSMIGSQQLEQQTGFSIRPRLKYVGSLVFHPHGEKPVNEQRIGSLRIG